MHPLVLLFGGESPERLVSVATAQNLSSALPAATCWFWSKDDRVFEISAQELRAHQDPFKVELVPAGKPKWASLKEALDSPEGSKSVFFMGLHGGMGEDGTVQRWLEERKLPFTASGSKACHLAFEKRLAKSILKDSNVRLAPETTKIDRSSLIDFLNTHKKIAAKPVASGSSDGFSVLEDTLQIDLFLKERASDPHTFYMAEAFVSGTELTVGVIDEPTGPRALEPIEIRAEEGRVFDYAGKYFYAGVSEIIPAEVSRATAKEAQEMALKAHQALGCYGYSRTDLIVDNKGPVYLETNTLPGFARTSLVPQELAYAGIPLVEFLNHQIHLALHRYK